MPTNALVQTRIDAKVKARAAAVLEEIGMTVSDAVRILLTRTANEGALPFPVAPGGAAHEEDGEILVPRLRCTERRGARHGGAARLDQRVEQVGEPLAHEHDDPGQKPVRLVGLRCAGPLQDRDHSRCQPSLR